MKNNKGFSLLEMIIVIAIMAVVTSVSFVGLGYLYSTNIKSSIKKINSSLLKTQSYTTAKSIGGRDVGMRIKKTSDGYYIEYLGIPGQEDEKIGNTNLKVTCYYDGYGSDGITRVSGTEIVDTSNPVDIYFDRSTGGLLPYTDKAYWKKIEIIANGSNSCTVTISKVTGKTEMIFDVTPTPEP